MQAEKRIIFLTGPPGAGKGTQSRILAEKHGWRTFSVGEILRRSGDKQVLATIESGTLVSAELTTRILMAELESSRVTIIIDGFPRNVGQARHIETQLTALSINTHTVIYLHITQAESWQRLRSRGRKDDERAVWEHRWEVFRAETLPAIEYCREQAFLHEINGEASVVAVSQAIEEALDAAKN